MHSARNCKWYTVYQLLAHGRWLSPDTPASYTTKTGRQDIAEILLKVALKHQKSNQKIKIDTCTLVTIVLILHENVYITIRCLLVLENITTAVKRSCSQVDIEFCQIRMSNRQRHQILTDMYYERKWLQNGARRIKYYLQLYKVISLIILSFLNVFTFLIVYLVGYLADYWLASGEQYF